MPILVALNKIDKPNCNIDQCKQQLAEHELLAEDWGGQTIFAEVSAKNNTGIDDLLNMILLMAEMQDLKANTNTLTRGVVIESKLSKTKGPIATLLIKSGVLKRGDLIVSGSGYGEMRVLLNDKAETIKDAEPGTPVEVLGFNTAPAPESYLSLVLLKKRLDNWLKKMKAKQSRFKSNQTSFFRNSITTNQ